MTLALDPYQLDSVARLKSAPRGCAILAHEPGLGKTACAIRAAPLPCLVFCPPHLRSHWAREIDKWRPEAAEAFTVFGYTEAEKITPTLASGFNAVICDEAHYLKSNDSQRSLRTTAIIRGITYRGGSAYALTGTPVPNRPIELWPLLWSFRALPPEVETYEGFAQRYAAAHYVERGGPGRMVLDVSGASHLDELRELIAPYLIRYTKAEVMPQLPPKVWNLIHLEAGEGIRRRGFNLGELPTDPTSPAFEAIADILHLQGLAKVPNAVAYVRDLLEQGVPKVVVFAHHRDVMDELAKGLDTSLVIRGGQRPAERELAMMGLRDPRGPRVIICQDQVGATGLDLSAASHVVIVEPVWVPGNLEQMADRCHRRTSQTAVPVVVDLLVAANSVDEYVTVKALKKSRVIERIMVDTPGHAMYSGPRDTEAGHRDTHPRATPLRPVPEDSGPGQLRRPLGLLPPLRGGTPREGLGTTAQTRSEPMSMEEAITSLAGAVEKLAEAVSKTPAPVEAEDKPKRKRGRPRGSANKPKAEAEAAPEPDPTPAPEPDPTPAPEVPANVTHEMIQKLALDFVGIAHKTEPISEVLADLDIQPPQISKIPEGLLPVAFERFTKLVEEARTAAS
jgi:SWI/SNF-related matrix-associated actin-dependent regulator 1 of chromatin subfamily A